MGLACGVHYPGRGQLTEKQADMRSSGASTGVIGRDRGAAPGDKGMAAIGVVCDGCDLSSGCPRVVSGVRWCVALPWPLPKPH